MAESVVTFFLNKLGSLITEEVSHLGGVDEQVKLLNDELEFIKSFLGDADRKGRRNETVNTWVRQVRDLAFDAEDAIDFLILETEQQQQRNTGLRFVCYPFKVISLHKLRKQINLINRRIEKISKNKLKYVETLESAETSSHSIQERRRTPIEVDVVGFKKEAEELTTLLTKVVNRQLPEPNGLPVVSIVGMGGLGKTTLAKNIYNRDDVKKHFDYCIWVNVSQEYSIRNILQEIIKQVMTLTKERRESAKDEEELREYLSKLKDMGQEDLGKELSVHLKQKKYLTVFDDVWKETDWDKLKICLPNQNENKQSRVLLTTRNQNVAIHADKSSIPHKLRFLDEEEGLNLLLRKALPELQNYPNELQSLGRKMVTKCHGSPLAIVVLGGLLSTKEMNDVAWKKVYDSANWQLNEGPNDCRQVLYLSFIDLPYYLKSCFLYLGLFPEDSKIDCERLIRLWVAEGFIQERGEETMEDVAQDYLEELTQRSMIQVDGRRYDGGFTTCRIHDLLRELAILEAQQCKFLNIYRNDSSKSLNRTRRLSIHSNSGNNDDRTETLHQSTVNHLHSLLCFTDRVEKTLQKTFYGSFKLLRVLDLEGAKDVDKLPKEIGQLIHLKYLSLANCKIKSLPRSIGNLCNLQSINFSGTPIMHVPRVIWKLRQLRHIAFSYSYVPSLPSICCEQCTSCGLVCVGRFQGISPLCWGLCLLCAALFEEISAECRPSDKCFSSGRPPRVERLRDLRTLRLPTGSWIAGGLHKLINLRELRIEGDLPSYQKNLFPSLVQLDSLQVLYLNGRLESLPDPCEFPPNLTELYLVGSDLKAEENPMVTLGKLPNLKVLLLWDTITKGKMVCSVQGFPKLEELRLVALYLEDLIVEQGAMPKLKYLRILYTRLKKLPDGLEHLTSLKNIWMEDEYKDAVQKDGSEGWRKIKSVSTFKKFTQDLWDEMAKRAEITDLR